MDYLFVYIRSVCELLAKKCNMQDSIYLLAVGAFSVAWTHNGKPDLRDIIWGPKMKFIIITIINQVDILIKFTTC